jgi:hypothetical protein
MAPPADRDGAAPAATPACDLPVHPKAREAFEVWSAIVTPSLAPAQNGFVAVCAYAGEPMLVCGFRAYAAARRNNRAVLAVDLKLDDPAVADAAWDEVLAVLEMLTLPELARADLATRVLHAAPQAMRDVLGLGGGVPLRTLGRRLGVPRRARRAFEARRLDSPIIVEALASLRSQS